MLQIWNKSDELGQRSNIRRDKRPPACRVTWGRAFGRTLKMMDEWRRHRGGKWFLLRKHNLERAWKVLHRVWEKEAALYGTFWAVHSKLALAATEVISDNMQNVYVRAVKPSSSLNDDASSIAARSTHVSGWGRRYGQRKIGHRYRRQLFDSAFQMTGWLSFFQPRSPSFPTTC